LARNEPALEACETGLSLWQKQDSNLYPQVAASFRRALAADPQNPDYHSLLGRVLLDLGEIHDASAELRWCFGFRPYSAAVIVSTHIAQGQCLELRGQPTHAQAEYRKALTAHPGQAMRSEAVTRLAMAAWHRAARPHCVVVYDTNVTPDTALQVATTSEATIERALSTSHVNLSVPILVYLVRDAQQIESLGLRPGDAREGRQQLYELAGRDPSTWQTTLIRIVSYHIAPTHSTDPVIRYGLWTLMAETDTTPLTMPPLALGNRPALSDLRQSATWDSGAAAQAALFVQYLRTTYGQDAFAEFWEQPSSEKGALVAYHKSLRDLETDWNTSLQPAPEGTASPSAAPSASPGTAAP
jgi:tetratricopeptide (TPR) repeat protein